MVRPEFIPNFGCNDGYAYACTRRPELASMWSRAGTHERLTYPAGELHEGKTLIAIGARHQACEIAPGTR